MRNIFKASIVFLIMNILVACTQTTTGIWNKPVYQETISQFLATKDSEELVFIGKEHHYIFSDVSSLINVLAWKDRHLLAGRFTEPFQVDSSNQISGNYAIDCSCSEINNDQVRWLEQNGFKKEPTGSDVSYRKTGQIQGIRYSSGDKKFPSTASLNTAYKIEIRTNFSTAGALGRAAFTPIAIAEDGVATLGLGILLIIAAPFVAIDMITNGGDSN